MPGFFKIGNFAAAPTAKTGVDVKLCWGSGQNTGDTDYLGCALQDRQTNQILGMGFFDNTITGGNSFNWETHVTIPASIIGTQKWRLLSGHQLNNRTQFQQDDSRDFDVVVGSGGTPDMTMWYLLAGAVAVAAIGGGVAYYYFRKKKVESHGKK